MSLAFLASFIAFILFLAIVIKRQNEKVEKLNKAFWDREARANNVRKKSLDGLNYINIPLETFPTRILQQDETVLDCIETIENLTSAKIVNLTGYTNTDLKLEYGTANITLLTEYDQNYTMLVRTLQKWADVLLETGYVDEAAILMEFAVQTGTDISRTYTELADYYHFKKEDWKIDDLIHTAEGIRSTTRNGILKKLREMKSI